MAANLSPVGNGQIMDANGNPIVGGKIYTYTAGSSIPLASYKDNAEAVAQSNPAITNTLGMLDDPLWLTSGVSYKIVIKDETDTTLQEFDNIMGVGSGSSSGSVDEWVSYSGAVTYISSTQFSVVGNQTGVFQVGRKTKSQNSGGISYGAITTSTYSSPNTTVTLDNSVLTLDSGLSAMYYGFLSSVNSSIPSTAEASVASVVDISDPGGTITWDLSAAPFAKITLDGNKTFDLAGLTHIGEVMLEITNPSTYTATFAAGYKFAGRPAYPPDLGSGGNVTLITGYCNGVGARFTPIPYTT